METKKCPDCGHDVPQLTEAALLSKLDASKSFWLETASAEVFWCAPCAARERWLLLLPGRRLPEHERRYQFTEDHNCGRCGAPVRVALGEVEPAQNGEKCYIAEFGCTAELPCAEISAHGPDLLRCIEDGWRAFSEKVPADAGPNTPKGTAND